MKKFWIQIIALMVVIIGSLYYAFQGPGSSFDAKKIGPFISAPEKVEKKVKIGNTEVIVEMADTPQLRSKGLGEKDVLPPDRGMMFIFLDTKQYRFWMKSMKFPIDMIFIKDSTVVDLKQNVPVPQPGIQDSQLPIYESMEPINKVLEVNTNFIVSHNIKIGDTIEIY